MSAHKDYLTRAFSEYLDRRSVPQHLAGKDKAQADEFSALLRALIRSAPERNFQEWWPRFEDALDSIMRTRVWPVVNEIRAAAKLVHKDGPARPGSVSFDSGSINARRILRGEPVGDEYVYGRSAVELIQAGEITEDNLRPYRSGLFFHVRDTLGNDEALRRERQYQLKHDAARAGAGLKPIFSLQMEAAE